MAEKMMYGCALKGFRATLGDTLLALGGKYENMVVVDSETGTATNVLDFREQYPERFVTVGIAEQTAVSFAFALSRSGMIPVVPLFSCFLARRACDQIYVQVGYANANVKLIGCYSGLSTPNTGATHQSINEFAILRSMPNIKVIETADPNELEQALYRSMEYRGPVFIRMIRGDVAEYDQVCTPQDHRFELDKASILRNGTDISLIACGMMVPRAIKAANLLADQGISADVVNCSSIKPIDIETIVASAKKTGKVITAENHNVYGGMGSAVAEVLAQHCPVPMRIMGIEDQYGWSGPLETLLPRYGITAERIVEKAWELLGHS
ncbi:MAG: transketolase family protein [Clostridia bacterium]|nr:transketolase family protein [Clostridia bacterium]